jgi:predicted membrane channel-forming protein YqfA (hemolysin III family)
LSRHECSLSYHLQPFAQGQQDRKPAGLCWNRVFDLGKLYSEHLLWLCERTWIYCVVLVDGKLCPALHRFIANPQSQITLIGIGCAIVSVLPSFRTPKWRPFRAGMFVAMGTSAVVPVLHGIFLFGFAQLERQMGVSWLILQGVLYISGAAIYAVSVFLA